MFETRDRLIEKFINMIIKDTDAIKENIARFFRIPKNIEHLGDLFKGGDEPIG